MIKLRARKLTPAQAANERWTIVAAESRPSGSRLDFPVLLEFVDTETGKATPVELYDPGDATH